MNESQFPSGPWVGFYNYRPGDKHRMDLHVSFANGVVTGTGNDDVGPFILNGRYDIANCESHWTKTYPGSHDVFYRGFREGKGIWGTWEIRNDNHGGFHIWPRSSSEAEEVTENAEQSERVNAIATGDGATLRGAG